MLVWLDEGPRRRKTAAPQMSKQAGRIKENQPDSNQDDDIK